MSILNHVGPPKSVIIAEESQSVVFYGQQHNQWQITMNFLMPRMSTETDIPSEKHTEG